MRLLAPRLAATRMQPRAVPLPPALRRWNSAQAPAAATASAPTEAPTGAPTDAPTPTGARGRRVSESLFNPAPGDTKPFMVTTPIFYVNACAGPRVHGGLC